jgi:hypothetical protein
MDQDAQLLAHLALAKECHFLNLALKSGTIKGLTFTWRRMDLIVTEIYPIDHRSLQVHTRCHSQNPFTLPLEQVSRLHYAHAQIQVLGVYFIHIQEKEQKNVRTQPFNGFFSA